MIRRWLLALGWAICVGLSVTALALDPRLDVKSLDLPAQSLAESLLQLSRVFGQPVLFPSELVAELEAPPVRGDQSLTTALEYLLAGVPIRFNVTFSGAVILSAAVPREFAEEVAAPPREETVVTGSHIRRDPQKRTPMQLTRLDRADLEWSGTQELGELLGRLPAASGNEIQVHNLNQPLTAGTAAFNLRNLGLGATLVLVEGHRPARAAVATTEGETFVDIGNLIPAVALERVDVVHGGVSAIYGSDAMAGVMNLQTRRGFRGLELQVRHQATDRHDQSDSRVSWLSGIELNGGDTQWLTAFSYLDRSSLATADREFTAGTAISSLGQPGTFVSAAGVHADPACGVENSRLDEESGYCLLDISDYFDLTPEEQRWQFWSRLEHAPPGAVQGSITFAYNRAEVAVRASPSFPFARYIPLVPVDNPGNPLGEPASFYGRVSGAGSPASLTDSRYDHLFLAAEMERHHRLLSLRAALSYSRNTTDYSRRDTLRPALDAALTGRGGSSENQYWNPLYGSDNDPDLVQSLFADWGMHGRSSLFAGELLAYSDWYDSTIGHHAVAAGLQHRREALQHKFADAFNEELFLTLGGGPDFGGGQDVTAAFVEWHQQFNDRFNLELALRHEDYDGRLSVVSPGVSVLWHPLADTVLRAAWSRSFSAPTLFQRVASQSVSSAVRDRETLGTPIFVNIVAEGTQDLEAAVADAWSAGVSFGSGGLPQFSFDAWRYEVSDIIYKKSAQSILDAAQQGDEAATSRILRDPITGHIERITTEFINGASVSTWGVDGHIGQKLQLHGLTLEPAVSFSWIGDYMLEDRLTGDRQEAVGRFNAALPVVRAVPRWRARLHLDWQSGRHGGRWQLNYIDGYSQDTSPGGGVASQVTLDAHYQWTLDNWRLGIGVLNMGNTEPPSVSNFLGYDAHTHDPRGRLWYIELNHSL